MCESGSVGFLKERIIKIRSAVLEISVDTQTKSATKSATYKRHELYYLVETSREPVIKKKSYLGHVTSELPLSDPAVDAWRPILSFNGI